MSIDPNAMKYLIQARLETDGVVEKPDVVGAIFGQTEGLLGEELDLRDLQKSGRIGRIEVEIEARKGRSQGRVFVPSSLDQIETSVMAAALETIDRIGPCKAQVRVEKVEDVRLAKRTKIVDRAKQLLAGMLSDSKTTGGDLLDEVRGSIQIQEITTWGPERLPAGPNLDDSEAVLFVEGRQDVLTLLKSGIRNAVAVEGTNAPKSLQELSKEKVVTVFLDGDRGGDLILKELLQVAEVDFVARAPRGHEVEELTQKQIMKCLRNKVPTEQYVDMYGLSGIVQAGEEDEPARDRRKEAPAPPVAAPVAPAAPVNPQVDFFRDLLKEVGGTSKAKILGEDDKVTVEVPVRELVETLKSNGKGAKTVVFDGIVTQRILDLASEIGIRSVVATKMGTVTNRPSGITVYTRDDFQ